MLLDAGTRPGSVSDSGQSAGDYTEHDIDEHDLTVLATWRGRHRT